MIFKCCINYELCKSAIFRNQKNYEILPELLSVIVIYLVLNHFFVEMNL